MTDPKEVERLMVEGAAEALRVVRENVTCYQKSPNDNGDDWLYDGQEIDELDPAEIVRALLASKPAPEAGECLECGQKPGTWEGCGTCDTGRGLEAHDLHACIPAPPAVCEACADPVYRPNPYKPHTCKPSGA